jgi:protein phosphatase
MDETGAVDGNPVACLHDPALGAVLSDWLLEQSSPAHAHLFGELLAIELADPEGRRTAGRRDQLLTEAIPHLPDGLLDGVRPWAWRAGLPIAATVEPGTTGWATAWLEHPVLAALKEVRTADPRVVHALSGGVRRWHLRSREALEALVDTGGADAIWPLELPSQVGPRAPEATLPIRQLALLVGEPEVHALAWLQSPVPLEVLRLERIRTVAPDVLEAARSHPTLQRLEWVGGAWDRQGGQLATRPLVRLAHPARSPGMLVAGRFRLVRQVTEGSTRRFWRAWDQARQRAVTLAFVDTFRSGRISLPGVLAPEERIRDKPALEVYPVDLQPLGPRPWSSAVVSSLSRIQAGSDWRGTLEPAFLEQVFVRADGTLAVVAPPVFVSEGWQSVDIQRRLAPGRGPIPWAGDQSRGPLHPIDEDGFGTGPDLVWVVANGIGGNTSAEGPCARALAAFTGPRVEGTPLEERMARAHRAARPQASHEDGVVVAVTALQLSPPGPDAAAGRWSAKVVRVGEVQAFRLTGDAALPITTRPPPEDLAFWVLGREARVPEGVEDVVLVEPGDRLLLCTEGITDVLDAAQIAAVVSTGDARDDNAAAVAAVMDAARARGGDANAAVVVVGPIPKAW